MSPEPQSSVDPRRELWRYGSYEIVGDWFRDASISVIDRVDAVRPMAPAVRWLDVATGTGAVAIEAARRGATVTAIDVTPELLDIARSRASTADVELELVADDFDHYLATQVGEPYDIITSSFGVIFSPDPPVTAHALANSVASSGLLGIVAWAPGSVFMVPESIRSLPPEPMPAQDIDRWAMNIGELFDPTGMTVVDQHRATQGIEFGSAVEAAHALERWSGGWAKLFGYLDSVGVGEVGRSAFVEHLERFGSVTGNRFVVHADYVVTVLRRER